MSPKKNVDKTPVVGKSAQGKTAKRTKLIKEKPKLKTPTTVKIKVPAKSTNKSNEALSPMAKHAKLTKKQFSKMKIELANEVANLQLAKEPITNLSATNNQEEKPVRKKGRKKKALPEEMETGAVVITTDSEDAFEKQKPKRKYVRKTPSKLVKTDEVTQNNDVVKLEENKSSPKKWKQSKITDMKISVTRNTKTPTNMASRSVKTCYKPKRRTIRPRGKKTCIENSNESDKSPSILDQGLEQKHTKEELTETVACCSPSIGNCPAAIDSRKTSMTSTSECLSWTKDISDSSTTTCITVCSSDFVRIDKKLPTVKLTNIDHKLKLSTSNVSQAMPVDNESSSDSESTDSSTKRSLNVESSFLEVDNYSLNLSTSSISMMSPESRKVDPVDTINDSVSKISKALDKLSSNLKKIDLEIINWIGYQNEDIDVKEQKIQERMFQALEEESNIIVQCQHIKRVLSDSVTREKEVNIEETQCTAKEDDAVFVKPSNIILNRNVGSSNNNDNFTSEFDKPKLVDQINHRNVGNIEKLSSNIKQGNNHNVTSEYTAFDHEDDDDALSLFAESISGMESSRRNSMTGSPPNVNVGNFEEYVPEPVLPNTDHSTQRLAYNPTKIVKDTNELVQNIKQTAVCEKQNADSTSIYKDSIETVNRPEGNIIKKFNLPAFTLQDSVDKTTDPNVIAVPINRGPSLFAVSYKPPPGAKNVVFKGMCFFNLISSCKNSTRCRFPHVELDVTELSNKLTKLSEDLFIQEYMLMKSWPILRRKYGRHFVNECQRRDLTRLLVEMSIDFVTRANASSKEDAELKVYVLELALLQLNSVDLVTCKDLLKFTIEQDTLLCDVFMQTIANTQNFSRFKLVFVNLTEFVIQNGRTFALDVASQILERIAILPYEESSARTLIKIIKHTDPSIFGNSMMGHFERQLCSMNPELYQALLMLKKVLSQLESPDPHREYVQPHRAPSPCPLRTEMEPIAVNTLLYPDREQRYTSPDTTHLDGLNKGVEEPIITRTINFDASKSYNTPSYSGSNSSESTDEYKTLPSHSYSWRNRGSYKFRPTFPPPGFRPMNRRHIEQRQVTYGGSPAKFPRRFGPDFL